jgi:hypothetical protein
VISGFRCDVDDIYGLLGYYTELAGSSVPTFRDNISVPSSSVKNMGSTAFPENSVQNYHSTLRSVLEERRCCHSTGYEGVQELQQYIPPPNDNRAFREEGFI